MASAFKKKNAHRLAARGIQQDAMPRARADNTLQERQIMTETTPVMSPTPLTADRGHWIDFARDMGWELPPLFFAIEDLPDADERMWLRGAVRALRDVGFYERPTEWDDFPSLAELRAWLAPQRAAGLGPEDAITQVLAQAGLRVAIANI